MGTVVGAMCGPTFHDSCCGQRLRQLSHARVTVNPCCRYQRACPTLQAMRTKNWMCVDNVFMTEDLVEFLICYDTAPSLRGLGTHHIPIRAMIDPGIPSATLEPYWNYRTADWKVFREELAVQLTQIPGPTVLWDDTEFQQAVTGLTMAIQATTEAIVPLSKPVPHSWRWWNEELMVLKSALTS